MPSPALTPSAIAAKEAAVKMHDWLARTGPDVDAWVELQTVRSQTYLKTIPAMEHFHADVLRIVDAGHRTAPTVCAGKSFDLRRQPGEQQSSLWVSDETGERCLVAASEFDAISDAITEFSPSPDAHTVVWALSHGGADWMVARFRDTATGRDLGDVIDGIKWPHFAWLDNETVAYLSWGRPPAGQELTAMNSGSSIRLHRLGTPQDQDVVLYRPEHVAWVLPSVSTDRKWLVVGESDGTVPAKIYRQLAATATADGWETVLDGHGHDEYIDVYDDETLVLSFRESSAGQVVGYRTGGAPRVIHEAADLTLDRAHLVGNRLVLLGNTLTDSVVHLLDLDNGDLTQVDLPRDAVLHDLTVDTGDEAVFIDLEQIGGPRRVARYSVADVLQGKTAQDRPVAGATTDAPERAGTPASAWQVSTVDVSSADGTIVPMRVIRAAGAVPAGDAKVFLSVYGGYGVPYLASSYDSWHEAWLRAGGVLAYAGVRGGSEYGQAWHEAGIRHNKQRGIDDLIACIEWFEKAGWSGPRSVVINGMSNGGLMVGAALTQRPDLLGGAVPEVAVVDMLNFHRYTAAHGWIREYGDPEVAEDRAMLAAYSPLHNISRKVKYPPTLILTADKDDRVPPGPHSYKLAAELQETVGGREGTYLRVAYDAGHATGRSVLEKVAERSAVLAFAAHALGLENSHTAPHPGAELESASAHEAEPDVAQTEPAA